MDCEDPGVSSPKQEADPKSKMSKGKCYDLKYLKKKIPVYIGMTNSWRKHDDVNELKKGLVGLKFILTCNSDSESVFNVLQSCGGSKHLVKLIPSCSDQRLLGLLLCILHLSWNKFSQAPWKSEMLSSGILCLLADVLANSSDINNQLRVLKLVSALSQHPHSTKEFQRSGVAKVIVVLLTQSQHVKVHTAAVKTLRRMWSAEKNHGKLLECGAVKAVASFLDTNESGLLGCILKTLVIFTNPCTISASQQVVGKGNGYPLIVARVGKPTVSELICNLSRSPAGRIELTRAGLVPEIIKQISSMKYDKYLIMALCQMCQESMVRASLRATPNGFETFLSLITNSSTYQYHSDLLYALTYFIYDTQSLTMMVRAGLVDVLIEKLKDVAATMGSTHEEMLPPDLLPASEYSEMIPPAEFTVNSPSHSSPESPKYSSLSSPTYPYCQLENLMVPSEISCSGRKKRKENEISCSKSQDSCILEVLLQLTYHHTKLKTLAYRDTVDTILHYMTTVDFATQETNFLRATKTLRAIVSCKHHFNKLLDDKTIMSIHRELCVKRHSNCTYCDKLYLSGQVILTEMAESSESALGEGEMAHRLTSGTTEMKTTVALTIPLIIKQPKILNSLLLMHRGLDCLIKALDSHIDDAVPALYSLMKTVGISISQKNIISCDDVLDDYPCNIQICEDDVNFKLDDGSAVAASKKRLVRNYPMFEAMFRGGFKEAGEKTVRLPDVSASCLKALVKLDTPDPCPCSLPSCVSTLLEMVSASDRFLSPLLSENLISHIINKVLSYETSPEIYSWCVHTGYKLPSSASMAITTVSYLFSANIFFEDRVQAVKQIVNSPERPNFFCDLNSIILSGMQDYHEKASRHTRIYYDFPQIFFTL